MNRDVSGADLLISVVALLIIDAAISLIPGFSSLSMIAFTRSGQIAALFLILSINSNTIKIFGLSGPSLIKGIKTGVIWSQYFGIAALVAGFILYLAGVNPLGFFGTDISRKTPLFLNYFFTACILSPVAEELFFRGFLYSWLRKFKVLPAIIISSLIFAVFHFSSNSLPVIQFTGAIVFAWAFEYSKSLAAPIIIHIAGNIALLCLTLIF